MLLGDPLRDRESEASPLGPSAAVGTGPRDVASIEPLEDMGDLVVRNAGATIGHRQPRRAVDATNTNLHRRVLVRELDGVVEQDEDELTEQRRIAENRRLLEFVHIDPN